MTVFALFWLVVYALVFAAVLVVRTRAARVIRRGNDPRPAAPTGSELGRTLLEERGLGVVTLVDADVDAYRAVEREIQLADGRFDQASPAAWAVVALEVAHAAQHQSGSPTWRRWWVVSGHTDWAAPMLLLVLLAQLVVVSPLLVIAGFTGVAVLAVSWTLSFTVERRAVRAAREMLEAHTRSWDGGHETERPLRWAARGYIAESIFDLGFLDRAAEPYRGHPGMGPDG